MVSVTTGASVSAVSTQRPPVAAAEPSVSPRRRVKGFRLRWAAGAGTCLYEMGGALTVFIKRLSLAFTLTLHAAMHDME